MASGSHSRPNTFELDRAGGYVCGATRSGGLGPTEGRVILRTVDGLGHVGECRIAGPMQRVSEVPRGSIARAIVLLDVFRSSASSQMSLTQLARGAGFPKSTTHRLLAQLEAGGLVERYGLDYRLGTRVFELGSRVHHFGATPVGIVHLARSHMSYVHVVTGLTVHLSFLEGNDVIVLDKIHGPDAGAALTGGRIPFNCSASGKVLLAFSPRNTVVQVLASGLVRRTEHSIIDPRLFRAELQRVRQRGVAYTNQESRVGFGAVAVPILDSERPLAAICVSGPLEFLKFETVEAHLRRAARHVQRKFLLSIQGAR